MHIDVARIFAAVAIGSGATLLMDLWNLFLKRAFGIASLSYCLLGRWLLHIPSGTFKHQSIGAASPKPMECPVGWIAHYSIGVVFALGWVLWGPRSWLDRPTLLPVLLYGIGTVVFPYFLLQPAIGLGVAASKAPKPGPARAKSLVTHTVFGVGLFLCALGVAALTSRG